MPGLFSTFYLTFLMAPNISSFGSQTCNVALMSAIFRENTDAFALSLLIYG